MIELCIVTWFAEGVAEHSLAGGDVRRVGAGGADVPLVSAGRIVRSGGLRLQPEVSLLSSFGVTSLPAPFVPTRFKERISRRSARAGARYAKGQLFVRCLFRLEVFSDLVFFSVGWRDVLVLRMLAGN
jgi:hypothetical protein